VSELSNAVVIEGNIVSVVYRLVFTHATFIRGGQGGTRDGVRQYAADISDT
jgi:hypothetical protein